MTQPIFTKWLPAMLAAVALAGAPTRALGFERYSENFNEEMAVGGTLSMGMGMALGDGYAERIPIDPEWKTLRFAAGGSAYFDYYFSPPTVGLHVGLGFIGKGVRHSGAFLNEDWRDRLNLVYMEIPIALKLNIDKRFQITAGVALWVAISGKTKTTAGDVKVEEDFEGSDWDPYHRANIGPKVSFAYSIPVGPVNIVPGATWSMHAINDMNNDDIPGNTDHTMRMMNIMLDVGVEWFFR